MSSLVRLQDVLKGFTVVKVDGDILELKSEGDTLPEEIKLENVIPRFVEYFKLVNEMVLEKGVEEPLLAKKIRPFLLPNEVVEKSSASVLVTTKASSKTKKGGNRKGGKKGSVKRSGEFGKIYTPSNPAPFPKNYISSNQPMKFSQMIAEGNLFTSSTTIPTFSATYFILNFLDQVTSLTNVFDQYRVNELEYWIEPLPGAASGAGGFLYSVIDYDDASNLTSINQACDYTNVISSSASDGHYRRFKPHIAVAAYSGTFTSFTNEDAQWIDSSSINVQHYGIKTACSTTTAAILYTIRVRVHFEMRNVR